MSRRCYLDMTRERLAERLGGPNGPSPTRARAFLRWLWRASDQPLVLPSHIDGVSDRVLARFRQGSVAPRVVVSDQVQAGDGTIKRLLDMNGTPVETVMIPGEGRVTVCVSSQSGCSRYCSFCATARMGFRRNLSAAEMVAQVLVARSVAPDGLPLRNVVFMGMGEPMDNLDAVLRAIGLLADPWGAAISPGHVTVSTSGVLPAMARFVERTTARLAISLNATTDEARREIMPIDARWSIADLMTFVAARGGERLFFIEYILMGGFNDSDADADRLSDLLAGLPVRVNLIPLNQFDGAPYPPPRSDRVQHFFERLNARGIRTLIRRPRGADIAAACGQLYRRGHRAV